MKTTTEEKTVHTEMREVQIPFAGTYNSIWSDLVDSAEEQSLDWMAEEGGLTEENQARFADYLRINIKYMPIFHNLAREYAEAYLALISDRVEFPVKGDFVEMTSPREYNFTTDRILCRVELDALLKILELPEVKERLPEMMVQQHKSRDGFHSFYSHEMGVGEWALPPSEWDHNQWHTVLLCLEYAGDDMDIYENIREAVDSDVFDSVYLCLDGFNEELAEEEAEQELEADDWIQPPATAPSVPGTFNDSLMANMTWDERLRYGVPMSHEDKLEAVRAGIPSHEAWMGGAVA